MRIATVLKFFLFAISAFLPVKMLGQVVFGGTANSYAMSDGQLASGLTLSNWTIQLWVKPQNVSTQQNIFVKAEYWKEFRLDITPTGSIRFITTWPNQYYQTASSAGVITASEWQLISIVGSGISATIYRNGDSIATGPTPGQVSFLGQHSGVVLGNLVFGLLDAGTFADTDFYRGAISNFMVWNRALSSSEISSSYNSFPSVSSASLLHLSGLENWIPFNETSGTTFSDIVGSASGIYSNVSFSSAIPEPSTYAVIFGVTVLGFAAYRKRKKSV